VRGKASKAPEAVSAAGTARDVLKDMLRRGTVSLDEVGRRLGHTRGYMSRALRGTNPLTLETVVEALEAAGLQPAEYFSAVARALAPPAAEDGGPSQARIEETVLRTLRRLGWSVPSTDDERVSKTPAR
jgi:hypothetical protein